MYQVNNWSDNFEGAKSKTYNNKTSCQMPTKHGLGYRRLVRQTGGAGLFGAWCALIQILSRQSKPRKGYLTDNGKKDGRPLTSDDLFILTDIPSGTFDQMLRLCTSPEIDWLTNHAPTDTVGDRTDTAGDIGDTIVPLDLDSDSDLDLDSNTPQAAGGYPDQFEAIWKLYLRKGNKKPSYAQWQKLSESDKDDAVEALKSYFQEEPRLQFRKDFERYLSNRVFEGVLERKANGCLNIPEQPKELTQHYESGQVDWEAERARAEANQKEGF